MRNLKRVLSLALACIMVIGMMVMTTGAADIADIDEVKNTEAVTVMNALEVLEGDENGNYNPNAILTREQAAKIICYMLMGAENAEKLNGVSNFTDVAADRWSAPFISYCATLNIISGYDGKFDPTGELTGVAFAKMLLVALGYDATVEGYVNNANWATNIASDAIDAGIDAKGVNLAAPLNRDNAAQMAFQTLTATMVKYDNKGTNITMADGTSVVVGASAAEAVIPLNGEDYSHNANGNGTLQFCEKYFEDLTTIAGGTDVFNRPNSLKWKLDTDVIYTVSKKAAVTYTAKTPAKVVAADLGEYKLVADNTLSYKVNNTYEVAADVTVTGLINNGGSNLVIDFDDATKNTAAEAVADLTTNGGRVEVYTNKDGEITDIITVAYSSDKVQKITTNKETGDVTYKIGGTNYVDFADDEVSTDTIKLYGEIAKGDVVTTVSAGGKLHVYPTTTFVGTQSAWTTQGPVRVLTIDGETYKVGAADSFGASNYVNEKTASTYYVDQYGFVVYREAITTASTDYAYVVGLDAKIDTSFSTSTPSLKARVVLADGTVAEYAVDLTKTQTGTYFITGIGAADNLIFDKTTDTDTDTEIETLAAADLGDYVYGYTIEDGVITFEDLTNLPANGTATDAFTVYGATAGALDHDYTSYNVNTDKYITVDDNTVFVAYNTAKNKATVYTGRSALPAALDGASATGYAVLKTGTASNVGAASVVYFSVAADLTADASYNYVYVNTADTTTIMVNGRNEVHYTGYDANGNAIDLIDNTAGASGIYVPNKDNKIAAADRKTGGRYVDATVNKVKDAGNDMIQVGSTFYYLTEDTTIVFVDDKLDEYDDNQAWVVLAMQGANVTSNVETIFVIGD